jgi:hypothetical protein
MQRCVPDLAGLTALTRLRASNTLDSFLEAPSKEQWCHMELFLHGYHPIMAHVYAAAWTNLARLRVLDFSHSDDLAL